MIKFIIGGTVIVAIGIVGTAIYRSSRKTLPAIKVVDVLDMADVVRFFKQADILAKLNENSNFIAVAIKEKKSDGKFRIIAALFDKEKNQVVSVEKSARWLASRLSDDLEEAFGDKSMIVLQ